MAKKTGLGKGLDALFIGTTEENNIYDNDERILNLNINEIEPNRNQPRKYFKEEALEELAESIKEHGMITPLVVSAKEGKYLIISGKRRYMAGLTRSSQLDEALKSPEDFLRVVYGG